MNTRWTAADNRRKLMKVVVVLAAVLALVLPKTGLLRPESGEPGVLVRVESLGHQGVTRWQRVPGGPDSMALYRLVYWTTNFDGAPVIASGLLVVPDDRPPLGVVSYQHGTIADRASAPSFAYASGEGPAVTFFAGAGHLVAAADYVGLGVSRESHPYLNARSAGAAVIDLLKAAHEYVTGTLKLAWPRPLYLTGMSQGGYSSLAAQRALERQGDDRFRVTACAPLSGPYNLVDIGFPYCIEGRSPLNTALVAYAMHSYADVYRQPLASILSDRYARLVPGLFDGERKLEKIAAVLPADPAEIFLPGALADIRAGRSMWLTDAMRANELFDWTPAAPVRLYYGDADLIISLRDAPEAARKWRERGGNVAAVSFGPYGHDKAYLALTDIREWFAASAPESLGR